VKPTTLPSDLRDPQLDRLLLSEVVVEPAVGVVAANRVVLIELAVPLRELRPELRAGVAVTLLVRSDRDFGHAPTLDSAS
jgi:hypothetical protein